MKCIPQIVNDLGKQDWGTNWNEEPRKVRSVILLYCKGTTEPMGAEISFQNDKQLTHLTWLNSCADGIDAWNGQQRDAMHNETLARGVTRYECYFASCTGGFYFSHKDRM